MDRDKLIRRATSHIPAKERAKIVEFLCEHPTLLRRFTIGKVRPYIAKGKGERPINFSLRLTAEEYMALKRRAEFCEISMSELMRRCCCI